MQAKYCLKCIEENKPTKNGFYTFYMRDCPIHIGNDLISEEEMQAHYKEKNAKQEQKGATA